MAKARYTEGNLYVRAYPGMKDQVSRLQPEGEDQGEFLRRILCDALDGIEAGTWTPPSPVGDAERLARAKAYFATEPDLRTKEERSKRGRG